MQPSSSPVALTMRSGLSAEKILSTLSAGLLVRLSPLGELGCAILSAIAQRAAADFPRHGCLADVAY
jgi:hypothetical protein